MIELCYQNEKAWIFSAKDWEALRREYRVVGTFVGTTLSTPALPVVLLPEEVALLVNKQLAKLVTYLKLFDPPTINDVKEYSTMEGFLLRAEQEVYKESRRCDLEKMIDKIMEGKVKKCNGSIMKTRDEVLEEELRKSSDINAKSMIWPILNEPLKSVQGTSVDVPLSEILSSTTPTRCAVYADLWEKGYFVTPGHKFGGDFLVYAGDPTAFHAIFIVRCVEDPDVKHHTTEIISFGRLGTSVKKRAVLAYLIDGSVIYITLNWLDT